MEGIAPVIQLSFILVWEKTVRCQYDQAHTFPVFHVFLRVSLSVRTLLSAIASEKRGKKAQKWNDYFEYNNDVFEIPPSAVDITARAHNYDFFIRIVFNSRMQIRHSLCLISIMPLWCTGYLTHSCRYSQSLVEASGSGSGLFIRGENAISTHWIVNWVDPRKCWWGWKKCLLHPSTENRILDGVNCRLFPLFVN